MDHSTPHSHQPRLQPEDQPHVTGQPEVHGLEALRRDPMMCHLLDALDRGEDIGHYGRLVFTMVARHFLEEEEVVANLTRDQDFSEEQARVMVAQVAERNYNPPRRERILAWQKEQRFPILPNEHDPDCGNVYKSLRFEQSLYDGIGEYREEKTEAAA